MWKGYKSFGFHLFHIGQIVVWVFLIKDVIYFDADKIDPILLTILPMFFLVFNAPLKWKRDPAIASDDSGT